MPQFTTGHARTRIPFGTPPIGHSLQDKDIEQGETP